MSSKTEDTSETGKPNNAAALHAETEKADYIFAPDDQQIEALEAKHGYQMLADPIDDTDSDEGITRQLTEQGVRLGKGGVAPFVFWPALLVILTTTIVAIAFPEATNGALTGLQNAIVDGMGWYYMLVVGMCIALVVGIGVSKYGRIRLGRDDERPEFGLFSWFAMLFAAGMGIGLVFYGVGEPLTFATFSPKPGWEGDQAHIAQLAMAQTFIHWGLHPWAVYAVVGLALAYGIHRRGRPVSIRWALEPLLGHKRTKGFIGDLVDVLAIVGTLFGVATSLGLGVQQISSGLASIGILNSVDNTILIVLICIITFCATASVLSGLGAGIRWLSNINLSLAGIFLVSILLMGPTLFMFQNLVESLGVYLANLFEMTFDTSAYTGEAGQQWAASWTIFYWGWWVSWAPFVGVFIARISRGRTVREFITGVLLVPTVVSFIWFAIMGGGALHQELFSDNPIVGNLKEVAAEKALFDMLGNLPLGGVLTVMAIVLVAIFFVTSSDSGSLVIDMLSSGGHPNPPKWSRILWALLEGAVAIALMLAGGLTALQAGSIATALPFSVVMILMGFATIKALRVDHKRMEAVRLRNQGEVLTKDLSQNFDKYFGRPVDMRIDYRLTATRGFGDKAKSKRSAEQDKSPAGQRKN